MNPVFKATLVKYATLAETVVLAVDDFCATFVETTPNLVPGLSRPRRSLALCFMAKFSTSILSKNFPESNNKNAFNGLSEKIG